MALAEIEATPAQLAAAAKCFVDCISPQEHLAIQTYLLALLAEVDPDPDTLAPLAKCFECLSEQQLRAIIVYLLCQLVT